LQQENQKTKNKKQKRQKQKKNNNLQKATEKILQKHT